MVGSYYVYGKYELNKGLEEVNIEADKVSNPKILKKIYKYRNSRKKDNSTDDFGGR